MQSQQIKYGQVAGKKSIIVLCDGMSDLPAKELGGKTPMECANKPNIDRLASMARVGLVKTVPDNMTPGSDVANLSVLGYDPSLYYTGRSSLEAASIGVPLQAGDITYRCNLVTLSGCGAFESMTMKDHCAGDISTPEADDLMQAIKESFGNDRFGFFLGIMYRHCMRLRGGVPGMVRLTPPHDILEKEIGAYLPSGIGSDAFAAMMKRSYEILSAHPVNQNRVKLGKRPANSIWLWGEGIKPELPLFNEKTGLNGAVISAVDLIKGIGICSGMKVCNVEGATGGLDTNFEGKARAAIAELRAGADFAFLHFEAPDECAHKGEAENKVKAIELIDSRAIPVLLEGLESFSDYKAAVLPDHATPLCTRTHSSDPVPFLIYQKSSPAKGVASFTEASAAATGDYINAGHELIGLLGNK